MSDNLKIRQPQDPKQINVHQSWELGYWSKEFGVTKEQLVKAVNQVGKHVEDVRRHFAD
jgi:hypothetical protein